jgi:type I phosphodiesterase/nucleotide pyrophosphatase
MTRLLRAAFTLSLALAEAGCGGRSGPDGHVILIDIDDHGLSGLWAANAPNIKQLIANGTLAFSRVVVPTHSNQNNMSLLTGQYPDGDDVPSNDWLSRGNGFVSPVALAGLTLGDYALYPKNPLLTRGDSVYRAVRAARGRSAYVGELPPFEAGADDVHLSIVGTVVEAAGLDATIEPDTAENILTETLHYPPAVASRYALDGPPVSGETQTEFTLRDAADYVRATSDGHPMPAFMFVWDFLALDDDPTSMYGADGPALQAIIEDYDAGLGELLSALDDRGLTDTTNILFTLDHGKVDTHKQVALGTHGGADADGQLAAAVAANGGALGVGTGDYALVNEDGDAQIYAVVDGAGTAAGASEQARVTSALLAIVQSGAIAGLDTTRTLTADGALGTRSFRDFRAASPNQADIVVFPQDDWTLNQVDPDNTAPGPFIEHTAYPYGRHGGFSADELYVPLIMSGPAFKRGVMLPYPVLHPAVGPTALAALGADVALRTAARGPIRAAFVGDPGETIAVPDPPDTARDVVLANAGYSGPAPAVTTPATTAVLIDIAGLYEDELFDDPATASAAQPFRDVAAAGTRFDDCWTDSRDSAVTEYQMLTGGYPVSPFVPAADDDPAITFPPGEGLLLMPPAALGTVANPAGYTAWRAATQFSTDSLFRAVESRGQTTAVYGTPDFHTTHIDSSAIGAVVTPGSGTGTLGDQLGARVAELGGRGLFALVALGSGNRTGNRHAGPALAELAALAADLDDVLQAVPGALVVITSRGATSIDDRQSDFYGPGSSRHVPLIVIGPNVRPGVVTGQPATPADIPATILYGMGATVATDVAQGTWAAGAPVGGVPQPSPATASLGHVLLRAFSATQGP